MSDTLDRTKSRLRAQMRRAVAERSPKERHAASLAACRRVIELDVFDRARVVMLYMPLADELDITPIALEAFRRRRTVCVPRVDWKRLDMEPVEATAFDDDVMDVDAHGLRSPRTGLPVVPTTIDVVVVPGLAFDAAGNRLGRGGGYYDRFLGRLRRSATAVGVAFEFQMVDSVPADERDAAVGMIVTDKRVVANPDADGRRRPAAGGGRSSGR